MRFVAWAGFAGTLLALASACGPGAASETSEASSTESDTGEPVLVAGHYSIIIRDGAGVSETLAIDFEAPEIEPQVLYQAPIPSLGSSRRIFAPRPGHLWIQEVVEIVHLWVDDQGMAQAEPALPPELPPFTVDIAFLDEGQAAVGRLQPTTATYDPSSSLWWLGLDDQTHVIESVELSPTMAWLDFWLAPAEDLVVWYADGPDQVEVSYAQLDPAPGPVLVASAAAEVNSKIWVVDDKLVYTGDYDGDANNGSELVVHARDALDAPPAVYDFTVESEYGVWLAEDSKYAYVQNVNPAGVPLSIRLLSFAGLVPSPPFTVDLDGLEPTLVSLQLDASGRLRFVYKASDTNSNGLARIDLSSDVPGPVEVLAQGPPTGQPQGMRSLPGSDTITYVRVDWDNDWARLELLRGTESTVLLEVDMSEMTQYERYTPIPTTWLEHDELELAAFNRNTRQIERASLDTETPSLMPISDPMPAGQEWRRVRYSPTASHLLVETGLMEGESTVELTLWRVPSEGGAFEAVFNQDYFRWVDETITNVPD